MRIALLSDIHGNREAFEATLAAVAASGVDGMVLLGDLVGYGPDPQFVVDRARRLAEAGTPVLRGNHDAAAAGGGPRMNDIAERAMDWTRRALDPEAIAWLAALPLTHAEEDRLYVHASAQNPEAWRYVYDAETAGQCLSATAARLVVCGHTHVPAFFFQRGTGRPVHFVPPDEVDLPLTANRRHVLVVGAVGQPRDGNPAACWALLDTAAATIRLRRTPYDVETTQRKIRDAGLPERLAARLAEGR